MECVKEIQKTLHNYTHARYLLFPTCEAVKKCPKKKQKRFDNRAKTEYNIV